MDYRNTFLEHQISTFDSPTDYSQIIQSDDVQRIREAVPGAERTKTSHTSEDRQNQDTIPMPTFAPRPLNTSSTYNTGGIATELQGRTTQTTNIGIAIRQIPQHTIVLGVENSIQKHKSLLVLMFHRMPGRSGNG